MPFKPSDGSISGVVIWCDVQGDIYDKTTINPTGTSVDASNLRPAQAGDYIYRMRDLLGGSAFFTQATQLSRPVLAKDRLGFMAKFIHPHRASDVNTTLDFSAEAAYGGGVVAAVPRRLKISNITSADSSPTSSYDFWNGPGTSALLNNAVGATSGKQAKVIGVDAGWLHVLNATGDFTDGETITWTDNNSNVKTAIYRGVAEGQQYMDGPSMAISSSGGCSVFIMCRDRGSAVATQRGFYFSHNGASGLAFGTFENGSTPNLCAFVNGTQITPVTPMMPSQSPQIYGFGCDATSSWFVQGDTVVAGSAGVAVPTSAAVPRLGGYTPGGTSAWHRPMDFYMKIVVNRKVTPTERSTIIQFMRDSRDLLEYTGLLVIPGYSITNGENAFEAPFYTLLGEMEKIGFDVRTNCVAGEKHSQIRTAILATSGSRALTAPYVNWGSYLPGYKYMLVPGNTNDYTITPNNVTAAMTAHAATITAGQGLGLQPITTTDVDKFYIGDPATTSQWRTDAAAGNVLIKALPWPYVDFAALPRMGLSGAAENNAFFHARYVHPNKDGHAIMAPAIEKVLLRAAGATSGSLGLAGSPKPNGFAAGFTTGLMLD